MHVRHVVILTAVVWFSALTSRSETLPRDPAAQQKYFDDNEYCHHVLAVDADGNALLPCVSQSLAPDGSRRYRAQTEKLAGEDTRGATLDAAHLRQWLDCPASRRFADDQAIDNVLQGRKTLCFYLDAMFRAIEAEQPDEVVIHIHGGLNNINGAIEKTALISDDLETHQPPDRRIFYIGICWNSDLFPTYKDHLLSIREGLHQPGKAIVTAPAMLLSDLGGAASRLPLDIISFLYQDIYTARPSVFKRAQLAQTRFEQIRAREEEKGSAAALQVSKADNLRPDLLRKADSAQWLLSQPSKLATTFFLDWLGSEPWKNMLRRTRTMFERESEFIPSLDFNTARDLASILSSTRGKTVDADTLLDQLNATGRQGAVSILCEQAQGRLTGLRKRPKITLIGHSMGTIVSCEILGRFHQLPIDNVVFMGAACSINDFKTKVVPYLQEQNLRESLRASLADELTGELSGSLQKRGASAETLAEARRQGELLKRGKPVSKTRFYNLCLHDTAENGEKNPAETDLVQRGSLLSWIDVLYQKPESENDRTLGRWVNALLATDSLPGDIVNRVTIKEFGLDRPLKDYLRLQDYAYRRGAEAEVQEPMHHGDFGRFVAGAGKESSNIAFWREIYRMSEMPAIAPQPPAPAPLKQAKGGNAVAHVKKVRLKAPSPTAISPKVAPPKEPMATREAHTGF